MPAHSDLTAEVVVYFVDLCWLGFLGILIVGKRGAAKKETKREMKSFVGFLMQCVAYAMCFIFHRVYFSPILPMPRGAEETLAAVTIVIALASVWLCFESARTLGKQWALAARVIEGHELITSGPYARVRNPIYSAMFGMLLATGFAFSPAPVILIALVVFMAGTGIRIGSEERLLREAFDTKFDSYARKVPALFPRIFR
jgi:protein-S-isoprenylcysteine O-methyltransferase Ste14